RDVADLAATGRGRLLAGEAGLLQPGLALGPVEFHLLRQLRLDAALTEEVLDATDQSTHHIFPAAYSHLKALTGSTRDARRAGNQHGTQTATAVATRGAADSR